MVGAGESALGPGGYPLIAAVVAPSRLGLAVALFLLGGFLGTGLAFFVGGPLVTWLATIPPIQLWGFGELVPWRVVSCHRSSRTAARAADFFCARRMRAARRRCSPKIRWHVLATEFWRYLRGHRRFYLCHNLGIGLQQAALFGTLLWTATFFASAYIAQWPAGPAWSLAAGDE